ncbi:acyltransferase [Vibrio aquaticus]|uniref:Acyltransferase n=1 Tax=Vibrio aquaticus TaxID=2496559 RepID=A0A432CW49_9VIBR|nr:acyltransferase [Vibrio aquaticus]RTZ14791.1 acyltransferase [Vibrio aquaticus]
MKSSGLPLAIKLRNKVRIKGEGHLVDIASNSKVRKCNISIKGSNNQLIIEEDVNIRESQIEIDGNNCIVKIGKGTVIGHSCYISSREENTQLVIGEDCMLSRNVKIMTSDGHDILKDGVRINSAQNISISNNVWLADNVTVLKGCSIGSGAIVGINSTLTKDLVANCIAAGNPAKCIQEDIIWQDELTY